MRFFVMFVTAVCVLFLIKLRWPKKKNFYEIQVFRNENSSQTNAYLHYSKYSYSGLIPNERAPKLALRLIITTIGIKSAPRFQLGLLELVFSMLSIS